MKLNDVPVEISNRHIHLCKEDFKHLFGKNKKNLSIEHYLSQPKQYLAFEKLDIVSLTNEKLHIKNLRIIGPLRKESQVEILSSDMKKLNLSKIDIRESGNLKNTQGIKLRTGNKELILSQGLIIAKRHVHIPTSLAKSNSIKNGDKLNLQLFENLSLDNIVARIGDYFNLSIHIDVDEAKKLNLEKFKQQNNKKQKLFINGKNYETNLKPSIYGILTKY